MSSLCQLLSNYLSNLSTDGACVHQRKRGIGMTYVQMLTADDTTGAVLVEATRQAGPTALQGWITDDKVPLMLWWDVDVYDLACIAQLNSTGQIIALTWEPRRGEDPLKAGAADLIMIKPVTLRQARGLMQHMVQSSARLLRGIQPPE
jgi:hypothetical protein